MTIKEEAIEFAQAHDLRVVPIEPGTKKPLNRDWATSGLDFLEIEDKLPDLHNYGVLCDDITVIDFDPRNMELANEDDPNEVESLIHLIRRAHGLGETLEVVTGSGGTHLYYQGATRAGILEPGVDIKSGPAQQVIGPGSLHIGTGRPYRVWANHVMAPAPDALVERGPTSTGDWDGKTTNELKEGGIQEGNRNAGLYKHLCHMRRKGLGDTEMKFYAYAINETQVKPPMEHSEVDIIIEQALKFDVGAEMMDSITVKSALAPEKPDAGPTGWIDLDALFAMPEPAYHIEHALPAVGVGHIVGPSFVGKTFIAIDLALRLATGADEWFGHKIMNGGCKVAYVAMEGGFDLSQRVKAWIEANGKVDVNNVTLLVEQQFDLLSPDVAEVLKYMDDFNPGLLIIDTQSLAAPGANENDNSEMTRLMSTVKYISKIYQCLVILVQHTGHDEGTRARGASAQYANMDVSFQLSGTKGKPSKKLEMTKLKSGPIADPRTFLLTPSGNSLVVEPATAIQVLAADNPGFVKVEWTEAQEKLLDILGAHGGALTVKTLADTTDASDKTVRRALKLFLEHGFVQEERSTTGGETLYSFVISDVQDEDAMSAPNV